MEDALCLVMLGDGMLSPTLESRQAWRIGGVRMPSSSSSSSSSAVAAAATATPCPAAAIGSISRTSFQMNPGAAMAGGSGFRFCLGFCFSRCFLFLLPSLLPLFLLLLFFPALWRSSFPLPFFDCFSSFPSSPSFSSSSSPPSPLSPIFSSSSLSSSSLSPSSSSPASLSLNSRRKSDSCLTAATLACRSAIASSWIRWILFCSFA
mmetsp:Transcript_23353/g.41485  ORF Transcript_23353/g.41485 Transcript_23353/m.41485 type:complete len:206 (+) Transcript_23353:519-1136(+)